MSESQAELLKAIEGGVFVYFNAVPSDRSAPYYFRGDMRKRCTREAKALLKAGLVEKTNEDWRGHRLRRKGGAS